MPTMSTATAAASAKLTGYHRYLDTLPLSSRLRAPAKDEASGAKADWIRSSSPTRSSSATG